MNQKNQPLVSIIIPVYNVESYLYKNLSNIQDQHYTKFEIIYVNDGSTDNSAQILKELEKLDARVRVVTQKNSGTGSARNNGVQNSKGEFIYFMDPDDNIDSQLLTDNIEKIIKRNADILVFDFNSIDVNGNMVEERCFKHLTDVYSVQILLSNFTELYEIGVFDTLWHKIFKKDFIQQYKVVAPTWSNAQDRGFLLRLISHGPRISFNKSGKFYYHYMVSRGGASTAKFRPNLTKVFVESAQETTNALTLLKGKTTSRLSYLMYIRDIYLNVFFNTWRQKSPEKISSKMSVINGIYDSQEFRRYLNKVKLYDVSLSVRENIIVNIARWRFTLLLMILKRLKN
ncbi:glycosyltransferase family 2 protein [Leuconostoc gelidum subsp. gasicomitatum]|uniref:glycosyltransferase family 2 protein n=1 Tax=Leuconostoc gasicomitatum TaxID=115778 RepID=UPI001CC5B6BC|nr:glycosyltransferase family 2 protein [Leuconostoc gasicomitatum]MBZ5961162.1 glycosyltransferase family 2 protein [Leuconostoc gasicomitatum]MBZ5993593.1 glycosyltransferase family 2 protein [Leuconostoc gasicomitatum]